MARQRTSQLIELLDSLEYDELLDLKRNPDINLLGVLGYDPISFKKAVQDFIDDNFSDDDSDEPATPEQVELIEVLNGMAEEEIREWLENHTEEDLENAGMDEETFVDTLNDYLDAEGSEDEDEDDK